MFLHCAFLHALLGGDQRMWLCLQIDNHLNLDDTIVQSQSRWLAVSQPTVPQPPARLCHTWHAAPAGTVVDIQGVAPMSHA